LTLFGVSLCSAVGNRVSAFNLVHNKSLTFPFENRVNVARIVVSPDGGTVLTIDEDGRALLVAAQRRTVLHHHSFKAKVGKMHIIYSLVWASCLGLVPSGLRLARTVHGERTTRAIFHHSNRCR
jgi:hypothetical protein